MSYFLSCIMAVESLFVSVMCELLFVLHHGCGVAFCVCICQGGVAASEVIVVKESVDQSLTHPAAEPARYLTAVVTGTRYLTAAVTGTQPGI